MKFTKLYSNPLFLIFVIFLIWQVLLVIGYFLTNDVFALQQNFLGGGMKQYLSNSLLWSKANFDGEHYVALARFGYQPLTYFFFPVYPILVSLLASFAVNTDFSFLLSGITISNVFLLIALLGLWRLLSLEFSKKIAFYTILVLLLFPTAFYFTAVYTESIFLALVVWAYYFAKKGNFFMASLLAAIASATKIIGIIMLPVLLTEYWQVNKKFKFNLNLTFILLSCSGLVLYMLYLNTTTRDPLEFLHSIGIYGEQRSAQIVLLPQVFYRYLFKILPNINYQDFQNIFTTWLEFLTGVLFLLLGIYAWLKLKPSYALYLTLGYLIPTFSGSFSSLPRYVLVLFPGFIIIASLVLKLPKLQQVILFSVMLFLLVLSQSLFTKGFWLS